MGVCALMWYDYRHSGMMKTENRKKTTIIFLVGLFLVLACLGASILTDEEFEIIKSHTVHGGEILSELETNKGTQFDPKIADIMLELLKNNEIGTED